MAKTVYVSTERIGGGSAIDGVDGNSLVKGDLNLLIESTRGAHGVYACTTEAQSESSPNVIVPNSNAGSWNWRLLDPLRPVFITTGMTAVLPNHGISIIRTTGNTVHRLAKGRRGYTKTIIWETSATPVWVRLSTAAANYAIRFQNIRSSGSSKCVIKQTSNQGKRLLMPPVLHLAAESTSRWHVVGIRTRSSFLSTAILAFSSST